MSNYLFTIFNRFGDSVIAASVTSEYINHQRKLDPTARFFVITSPQMKPYLEAIIPNAEILKFNKKNPLSWLCFLYKKIITYNGFDFGFNPYSYGKESFRLIQHAKNHKQYKSHENTFAINYYDRVRLYFNLPTAGDFTNSDKEQTYGKNILICPESSELRRTLTTTQLEEITSQIRKRNGNPNITICATKAYINKLPSTYQVHLLGKSEKKSKEFIKKLIESDLIVSVDSGPLHIATALNKPTIGIFSSALPATVMNAQSIGFSVRHPKLFNIYCEKTDCINPYCMDSLNLDTDFSIFNSRNRLTIYNNCPYKNEP